MTKRQERFWQGLVGAVWLGALSLAIVNVVILRRTAARLDETKRHVDHLEPAVLALEKSTREFAAAVVTLVDAGGR